MLSNANFCSVIGAYKTKFHYQEFDAFLWYCCLKKTSYTCYLFCFFPALLRYNWHIILCKFMVYKLLIWYIYILQNDYQHSNHSVSSLILPSCHITTISFLGENIKIYSYQLSSTQLTLWRNTCLNYMGLLVHGFFFFFSSNLPQHYSIWDWLNLLIWICEYVWNTYMKELSVCRATYKLHAVFGCVEGLCS